MGLHDLTHLIHQWNHPVPFGAQNPMLSGCPASDGGHCLIRGDRNLARGHDFHPAIHCGFDLLSGDPGATLDGLIFISDFPQDLDEPFLRHHPGDSALLPSVEGGHGNTGFQLWPEKLGDLLQRQAVVISQFTYLASQVSRRLPAGASAPGGRQADFDLTPVSLKRVDQVIQECVSHGKPL